MHSRRPRRGRTGPAQALFHRDILSNVVRFGTEPALLAVLETSAQGRRAAREIGVVYEATSMESVVRLHEDEAARHRIGLLHAPYWIVPLFWLYVDVGSMRRLSVIRVYGEEPGGPQAGVPYALPLFLRDCVDRRVTHLLQGIVLQVRDEKSRIALSLAAMPRVTMLLMGSHGALYRDRADVLYDAATQTLLRVRAEVRAAKEAAGDGGLDYIEVPFAAPLGPVFAAEEVARLRDAVFLDWTVDDALDAFGDWTSLEFSLGRLVRLWRSVPKVRRTCARLEEKLLDIERGHPDGDVRDRAWVQRKYYRAARTALEGRAALPDGQVANVQETLRLAMDASYYFAPAGGLRNAHRSLTVGPFVTFGGVPFWDMLGMIKTRWGACLGPMALPREEAEAYAERYMTMVPGDAPLVRTALREGLLMRTMDGDGVIPTDDDYPEVLGELYAGDLVERVYELRGLAVSAAVERHVNALL